MRWSLLPLVCVLLIPSSALAWGGKDGDSNATGEITDVKATASHAVVTGSTEDGSLWLGCTVTYNDDGEFDRKPVKVRGKFRELLTFAVRGPGVRTVTVALWRWKISAKRCTKDNGGEMCEYCRKNGYHLEDRVDRDTASP